MTSNGTVTQEPPGAGAYQDAFGGPETPFQRVKPICTSLLKNSKITPNNTSQVIDLLSRLILTLRDLSDPKSDLTPKFIEFIYLPLSIILNRNGPPAPPLPDQILEKLFQATSLLCQQWWWAMDFAVWEQLLRLSAYLIGGPRAGPTASLVARSEETKEAAALCLEALLRERTPQERPQWCDTPPNDRSESIAREARQPSHFTVIGSAIGSLLDAAESEKVSLRALSLRVVGYLLSDLVPSSRLPTFLPGVVAKSCRVAIAQNTARGWQASNVIKEALLVLNIVIVGSIGDEVCEREGILRKTPMSFDDIANMANHSASGDSKSTSNDGEDPYAFHRTESWLQASASQIHNAINTLSPIISHPTPSAQLALAELSYALLSHATRSLPTLHPLLLSNLLTLSVSSHSPLADAAKPYLETLLASKPAAIPLLDVLAKLTQENLLALPPLILANSDEKVERVCNQIEAICVLSHNPDLSKSEIGVGHLLGPTGGIERWGLGLLGVVELTPPPRGHSTFSSSTPVGLIMDSFETPDHPFPKMRLRYVNAASAQLAVERMLRGLGAAGGVDALFSVEWFMEAATAAKGALEVSALWCAARVYEGIVGVILKEFSMPSESRGVRTGAYGGIDKMKVEERRRVEKTARQLVRTISEFWETDALGREEMVGQTSSASDSLTLYGDSLLPTEHFKGLDPLVTLLDVRNKRTISISTGTEKSGAEGQEMAKLHAALALQTLSISSSALGSRFPPLFIHAIYPILRSLVSSNNLLSSTAMAALHHVTTASSYAAPANLLLSNFDYALDSASRRLFRNRLDLKATKVLVILVRLVGKDVVQRAGDVVEECFDRLDEYHGYSTIVEGLVEVLSEVVKAVEAEEGPLERPRPSAWGAPATTSENKSGAAAFMEWYKQRKVEKHQEETPEDFGPAPHQPWGREQQPGEDAAPRDLPSDETSKPSITQTLISKIIRRCLPFLTHSSPLIRARMLSLMRSASVVLPVEEIGSAIHSAWPFILNRLKDSQTFVVVEAAKLIDSLTWHFGEFMGSRMHQDVWPAYRKMLEALEAGDRESALTARKQGPEAPYSHSHRLYVAMLRTLNSLFSAPQERNRVRDEMTWDIAVKCRRFLSASANKDLQATARTLYQNLGRKNDDLVWLVLCATCGGDPRQPGGDALEGLPRHLREAKWDINENASIILNLIA